MAQVIDVTQSELISDCRRLRRMISVKQYNHKRRLRRLKSAVAPEFERLSRTVSEGLKTKDERDTRKYSEYKQAYRLVCLQMENLIKSWSESMISLGIERPPRGNIIEAWREYQFDLEDAFEDLERLAENEFRQRIFGLLTITDTLERLQEIGLPEEDTPEYISTFYQVGLNVQDNFQIVLRRRRIKPIPLFEGDFPPVETTRIIAREDQGFGDRMVIIKVVEKGYTYKNRVLRKASVIVIA